MQTRGLPTPRGSQGWGTSQQEPIHFSGLRAFSGLLMWVVRAGLC